MRSWCVLIAVLVSSPAMAQTAPRPQPDRRLPIMVLDGRGVFTRLGRDKLTAASLGLDPLVLPATGLGLTGGVHLYPIRGKTVSLGVGAEVLTAVAKFEPVDATTLKPTGEVYRRRIRAASGQLSLNFGHKAGWSYLTMGYGPLSFDSYKEPATPGDVGSMTLNYGGGARWFDNPHLAFTIDLRFYATRPEPAAVGTAPRERHKVFVLSAGFAIK
jgi:hypothetical protein